MSSSFAGKTLGLVEAGSTPVEIGETLETLRYTDFGGTLHGSFAAHPHVDPLTGEMHGICYDVSRSVRSAMWSSRPRARCGARSRSRSSTAR